MLRHGTFIFTTAIMLMVITPAALPTQQKAGSTQSSAQQDDPEANPPVTAADLKIVQRARQILGRSSQWNRADNRKCPNDAKTFSIYCALAMATKETNGNFAHRGAVMQQARFVIDETAPNAKKYDHRLMDYNNDPSTTFDDVQKFFKLLEQRVALRLRNKK